MNRHRNMHAYMCTHTNTCTHFISVSLPLCLCSTYKSEMFWFENNQRVENPWSMYLQLGFGTHFVSCISLRCSLLACVYVCVCVCLCMCVLLLSFEVANSVYYAPLGFIHWLGSVYTSTIRLYMCSHRLYIWNKQQRQKTTKSSYIDPATFPFPKHSHKRRKAQKHIYTYTQRRITDESQA